LPSVQVVRGLHDPLSTSRSRILQQVQASRPLTRRMRCCPLLSPHMSSSESCASCSQLSGSQPERGCLDQTRPDFAGVKWLLSSIGSRLFLNADARVL